MTKVVVKPVESRSDQRQFLKLPWTLYDGDPNWIPPLLANQRALLNFTPHPFYQDAETCSFLALRNNKPAGRLTAIVNHAHNRQSNEKRGFFGFFESIDNQEVAAALFNTAGDWLKRHGMTDVRGPANPSLNYECGLLVDGFDTAPFFMMTYNKPYYGRLIENCGLAKSQDMYAFWGHISMLDQLDEKLSFIAEEAQTRFNVKVRPLDKSRFRDEVQLFLDIYNQSLVSTWGFVPLSSAEIKVLAKELQHLIVPELCVLAEVDGKPVGACFGLLDYNPRIKAIDGRLWPFGFFKLLRNKRGIKRARLLSTNVIPEYQRWGVGLVILRSLVPKILEWGLEEIEFSWVLESNTLSRGSLTKGGAKITKTYRMYDAPLEALAK